MAEGRLRKSGPAQAEIVNKQISGRQNYADNHFPCLRQKCSSPCLPKALSHARSQEWAGYPKSAAAPKQTLAERLGNTRVPTAQC
jgi:hypothetical protein